MSNCLPKGCGLEGNVNKSLSSNFTKDMKEPLRNESVERRWHKSFLTISKNHSQLQAVSEVWLCCPYQLNFLKGSDKCFLAKDWGKLSRGIPSCISKCFFPFSWSYIRKSTLTLSGVHHRDSKRYHTHVRFGHSTSSVSLIQCASVFFSG